jgi:nitrate/TMAO reductase-like tetraheme cytochrome c subunit
MAEPRRGLIITVGVIAAVVIAAGLAFEPVTREYVATDAICATWCHVEREYRYTARMAYTSQHPPAERIEQGIPEHLRDRVPARCVDCHVPPGFINAVYTYTHYLSMTDLFGRFRDREGERAGDWIPLSAARAYRVRARLTENASVTCNTCHVMEEIKPESVRGQTAHKDALSSGESCIDCHANLVHRFVEVRVAETEGVEEEGPMDEFDTEPADELEEGLEESAPAEEEIL